MITLQLGTVVEIAGYGRFVVQAICRDRDELSLHLVPEGTPLAAAHEVDRGAGYESLVLRAEEAS